MIESEIQKYLDKSAIKELLTRYAICVDTGDADGFAELLSQTVAGIGQQRGWFLTAGMH